MSLQFPTPLHEQTAEAVAGFFAACFEADTVLMTNSIARGKAIPESDLDMIVLTVEGLPENEALRLDQRWREFFAENPLIHRFRQSGHRAHIHLDVITGQYIPQVWDEGGGPDFFEVEIGNHLKYGAPFGEVGPHYLKLRDHWLPYYDEALRQQRLAMVKAACQYDLEQVPFFVGRELYFQAFDRLYKAFQEFLQAVFIAHRCYPIAYNKWIREQFVEWLKLELLYPQLAPILSVRDLESSEIQTNARTLQSLLEHWT